MKNPKPKASLSQTQPLLLGGLPVETSSEAPLRIAILLWGAAGCGKTTLLSTLPGKKLWINLDPDGRKSLSHRDDVLVVDLEGLSKDDLFKQLQNDNPLGLDQFLADHPEIESVVFDSATALAYRALQMAVQKRLGASQGFTPTMEAPGIAAYGGRNAIVLECLTGLLRVTAKHGRHVGITTHEDDPTTDKEGNVLYITATLGGKITNNVTWRLSEIWYMSQEDTPGKRHIRKIAVRRTRLRQPMKTRMFGEFAADGKTRLAEFTLQYDAELPDNAPGQNHTLAKFFEAWVKGGGAKLPVPN